MARRSSDQRGSVLQHLTSSRPAHSPLTQLGTIARGLALPPAVARQLDGRTRRWTMVVEEVAASGAASDALFVPQCRRYQ